MDSRNRTVSTDHAAEQMAESIRESYQALTSSALKLQERNLRFSQDFFEVWSETLMKQAEANRTMVQGLAEQSRRQQEAFQTLIQEGFSIYLNFLSSMFFIPGGSKSTKHY